MSVTRLVDKSELYLTGDYVGLREGGLEKGHIAGDLEFALEEI